jgi:probable HAF family extracellular repeat protein
MTLSHCFKIPRPILATALITVLGLGTDAIAQERPYFIDLNSRVVTPLDTLGDVYSLPEDINNIGEVVARNSATAGPSRSFIAGPDGAVKDLGRVAAYGINDTGQVAGAFNVEGHAHAFITDPGGMRIRDLGTSGGVSSFALAISSSGQVAGNYSLADDPAAGTYAFITGPDGIGIRDIGTLGSNYSVPSGINDAGQVVGMSSTTEGKSRAFITGPNGMGMRDLGTLGSGDETSASAINNVGQVVGNSRTSGGEYHAFITATDGTGMRDLGTLGGESSSAFDINDAGQVVGHSDMSQGLNRLEHAFITGADGTGMIDLNSVVDLPQGVILTDAKGINNNGQVIAMGTVPEPESYALLLAGLVLIGSVMQRKKMEMDVAQFLR